MNSIYHTVNSEDRDAKITNVKNAKQKSGITKNMTLSYDKSREEKCVTLLY